MGMLSSHRYETAIVKAVRLKRDTRYQACEGAMARYGSKFLAGRWSCWQVHVLNSKKMLRLRGLNSEARRIRAKTLLIQSQPLTSKATQPACHELNP